jgi:hypothetical protein
MKEKKEKKTESKKKPVKKTAPKGKINLSFDQAIDFILDKAKKPGRK